MQVHVLHYDAFATVPHHGNPAGVVLDAPGLSDDAMQQIAVAMGFNETAFVLPSDRADLRIRYWTPGHEVNLCGHATVATMFALHERGLLPASNGNQWIIETGAGLLPIAIRKDEDGTTVRMTQTPAQFEPFVGDIDGLARVLGLQTYDLRLDLPIVYGNTGLWTLLVPVCGLDAMRRMQPQNAAFPAILRQMPRASLHPFCFETDDPNAQLHARHFSSPFSGTIEDPVTGTASGVLVAFLLHYLHPAESALRLTVEQGQELGRDGRVKVEVQRRKNHIDVWIEGTAVAVGERDIDIL